MKKLARFPDFEELTIEHGDAVRAISAKYPPYSDLNFTNLYAWNTAGSTRISGFPEGYAVLMGGHAGNAGRPGPSGEDRFYSLIGSEDVLPVIGRLLEMSRRQGHGRSLRRVPGAVVDNLSDGAGMIVREDRDNFDYLLSSSYLAGLAGAKNQNRRRLIRQFLDVHGGSLKMKRLDLADEQAVEDVMTCASEWISLKPDKDSAKYAQEKIAIERVLKAADRLPVKALGFYVDGAIRAFSIFEYLHGSTGVVHFEKCDLRLKGLSSYVRHQVAKEFLKDGVASINYEQDLGIEGLRKAKQMLHPVDFLKKYTVSG